MVMPWPYAEKGNGPSSFRLRKADVPPSYSFQVMKNERIEANAELAPNCNLLALPDLAGATLFS
jgi:hypothetical protein